MYLIFFSLLEMIRQKGGKKPALNRNLEKYDFLEASILKEKNRIYFSSLRQYRRLSHFFQPVNKRSIAIFSDS